MIARGGIDLGGTKVQTVVVNGRWKVLGEARRPTPTTGGPEDVAEQMAEAMREAAQAANIEPGALAGVGVGSPGEVDQRTGSVSHARNLPGWEDTFKLGPWLAKQLGTKVKVGNDVQVATEAEFRLGAGRPYKSLVGVFWGGGIGTRLGEPYAKRIVKAMHPHLFNDDKPPAVQVASLGDLGGAIGAALQIKG